MVRQYPVHHLPFEPQSNQWPLPYSGKHVASLSPCHLASTWIPLVSYQDYKEYYFGGIQNSKMHDTGYRRRLDHSARVGDSCQRCSITDALILA
jgi:hypothetical protein